MSFKGMYHQSIIYDYLGEALNVLEDSFQASKIMSLFQFFFFFFKKIPYKLDYVFYFSISYVQCVYSIYFHFVDSFFSMFSDLKNQS